MAALQCWNCGASLADLPRPITRHMNCPACFEDLHCCRLCRHYAPSATPPCDEDRADPPVQKETANFCEFFRPRPDAFEPRRGSRSAGARASLESLFASPDAENTPTAESAESAESAENVQDTADADDAESAARRRLEALFQPAPQPDSRPDS